MDNSNNDSKLHFVRIHEGQMRIARLPYRIYAKFICTIFLSFKLSIIKLITAAEQVQTE